MKEEKMKKDIKKDIFLPFVLIFYCFHGIVSDANIKSYKVYIYILVNIVAAALLYVIKNKYISLICSLVPLVAMAFIEPECLYFSVIPILMICAHKNIISEMAESDNRKAKNDSIFYTFLTQGCLFLSVAFVIYDLVLMIENQNTNIPTYLQYSLFILFWLLIVFVFSLIDSHKNKNEKKMQKIFKGKLRFLYFISVFGFFATMFYCCVQEKTLAFTRFVILFPWLLFVCATIYNDDPYIKALSDEFEKISSKRK